MKVRSSLPRNRLLIAAAGLVFAALGASPANSAEHSSNIALTPVRGVPGAPCGATACGVNRACHQVQTNSSAAAPFPPRHTTQPTVSAYSYPAPDPRTPRRITTVRYCALDTGIASPIYLATLRLRI